MTRIARFSAFRVRVSNRCVCVPCVPRFESHGSRGCVSNLSITYSLPHHSYPLHHNISFECIYFSDLFNLRFKLLNFSSLTPQNYTCFPSPLRFAIRIAAKCDSAAFCLTATQNPLRFISAFQIACDPRSAFHGH